MPDNFAVGQSEADVGGSSISQETMGPAFKIVTTIPGSRGSHVQQIVNYMMPSVKGRNGSTEKVDPAIVLTPLGGMVPGPNAIPPAIPSGGVGTQEPFPIHEDGEFRSGVIDGWPEGPPVPVR